MYAVFFRELFFGVRQDLRSGTFLTSNGLGVEKQRFGVKGIVFVLALPPINVLGTWNLSSGAPDAESKKCQIGGVDAPRCCAVLRCAALCCAVLRCAAL